MKIKSLTIATKVIAGFVIIILLLLTLSITSVFGLNDINKASDIVNDTAMPVLTKSNELQVLLLKKAKQSALAYNKKNTEEIQKELDSMEGSQQQILASIKQFNKRTIDSPEYQKLLKDVNSQYLQYHQNVVAMLNAKLDYFGTITMTENKLKNVVAILDESGALVMDLTYIDTDKTRELEVLSGLAATLDNKIFMLTNSLKDVASASDLNQLIQLEDNIKFSLSEITVNTDYLIRFASQFETGDILESLKEEITKLEPILLGGNGLIATKNLQLKYAIEATNNLSSSEQSIQTAITTLDELLTAAKQQTLKLQSSVSDTIDSGRQFTIFFSIILVLLGAGIAFLTIKAMLSPLSGINKMLKRIASGDLTRTLEVKSQDEFGQLSENVNQVVVDLRELISGITDKANSVNRSAKQSSNELVDINDSIVLQKQEINEANEIADQLVEQAQTANDHAAHATEKMKSADSEARQVRQTSENNSAKIAGLAKQLDDANNIIRRLQEQSNNIGGITDSIRGIAEQTNLLALNAAIEAARAGEQGRGFAVVADEVRSLAGRTQSSTNEIHAMIETLQSETSQAVKAIDKGKIEAEGCVKQTETLSENIVLIQSAIQEMQEIGSEIENSAQDQNNQIMSITSSLKQLLGEAEKSEKKATLGMEHCQEVSNLSSSLRHSIQEFKVE